MAENKSQAQHLTSLDFDISGLIESLKQADEQTQKYALEIGRNAVESFNKGVSSSNAQNATNIPSFLDEKQLSDAKSKLDEISSSYSKLAKTVMTYDADNNLLRGSITYDDSAGKKIVEQYQMIDSEWKKITSTQTNDIAKREKLEQKEIEKTQKLREDFYKRNLSQIDAEINERERQSKVFSAQIKEQMTLRAKEEAEAQNVVVQIERMIEKQKQFNNTVSQQKSSSINKGILSESNQYISDLEKLKEQISDTGKVSDEQKKKINEYSSGIKDLSGYYQEAGTKGESFLQKISDKAKWLGAFYVVNELKNGFFETINIIKETEDAVISLQRVLNDDSISASTITDELYDIAYEYGRTFDEVSEVSQLFVQSGKDWADTIEMTRGTMLALNTAELDVTQSTEGLIAIMAQWGLEAEDYADVIDKINITADNFAVTSEKIVSALQRSSSSAKNANISLEETIGIITAMAEATGRSGENIGTALNSLIIYTSKAGALETFAKNGSDAMKEVVSAYQKGAISILDVWKQLSEELSNLSASQQSALFQSEEYQEFADILESQAEEYTSQIKEIYGAAGTYRQNYFIALLNDMNRAQQAVEGMADAEGYSLSENEKYMQSLTANWNQLKSILAELAVQLGEAGLLDFLKSLAQAGMSLAEFTKNAGGLLNVLTLTGSILLQIKAQKIGNFFTELNGTVKGSISNLKNFKTALIGVATAQNKVAAAGALIQSAFGWIGLITTGLSILYGVISSVNAATEESKRQSRENASAKLEEAKSISSLKNEYIEIVNYSGDLSEKTQKLIDFKKKLITEYGLERDAVEKLNGERAKEIDFLDNEYASKVKNAWVEIRQQYEEAVRFIEQSNNEVFLSQASPVMDEKTLNVLREYLTVVESVDAQGNVYGSKFFFNTTDLQEQRDILAEILTSNQLNKTTQKELQAIYDKIVLKLDKYGEAYSTGNEAAKEFFLTQESTLELIEKINSAQSESERGKLYDELLASVKNSNFGLEAQKDIIEELSELFSQLSENASDSAQIIENSFSDADAQIELLEEQKEAIKEKYDAEIEALKEVESENDRIRKKEEYYRNREEALKDIESASTRSGVEYREQEQEAREKLDELDREWQETLEDWSIEDKIAELEALRDAEIAALDAQIESLQQSVSGTASTIVNSFSNVNSQILSNYQTEYLEPAADKTKGTYEGVSIDIIDIFGKTAPSFQELSSKNAQNMYSAYEKNFFIPMQKSIIETQRSFSGISVLSPNFSPFPVMDVGKYYSEQNIVNNNTKSSNMFANIYNNSGANTIFNNFFAKP